MANSVQKLTNPNVNLEQARDESLALVTKSALVSAGGAIVPIPFFDLVVDMGVLIKLMPEINEKFGLPAEHVTIFDPQTKQINWSALRKRGLEMSSFLVARTTAKRTINGFVGRIMTRQVTKFIPLGGSIVAGTLGYKMMKKLAEAHIEECYQTAKRLQNQQQGQVVNG